VRMATTCLDANGHGYGRPLLLGREAHGTSIWATASVSIRPKRHALCRPRSPGPTREAG